MPVITGRTARFFQPPIRVRLRGPARQFHGLGPNVKPRRDVAQSTGQVSKGGHVSGHGTGSFSSDRAQQSPWSCQSRTEGAHTVGRREGNRRHQASPEDPALLTYAWVGKWS